MEPKCTCEASQRFGTQIVVLGIDSPIADMVVCECVFCLQRLLIHEDVLAPGMTPAEMAELQARMQEW